MFALMDLDSINDQSNKDLVVGLIKLFKKFISRKFLSSLSEKTQKLFIYSFFRILFRNLVSAKKFSDLVQEIQLNIKNKEIVFDNHKSFLLSANKKELNKKDIKY